MTISFIISFLETRPEVLAAHNALPEISLRY